MNVTEQIGNRIKLNYADITKLMIVSDSEEKVSQYENHTSDEIDSERSENDFDNDTQQMNYKEIVLSKDREIELKLESLDILLTKNIMKTSPGVTRYEIAKITDVKKYI